MQAAARQLAQLSARFARLRHIDRPGTRPCDPSRSSISTIPERRAPVNTVPGLIGVILTMTMVIFTAMAIVRERERGNMEMLIATPLSPTRADDRQGAALHRHRPGPGHADPDPRHARVRCTGARIAARRLSRRARRTSAQRSRSASLFRRSPRPSSRRCRWPSSLFLPQILLSGFMFPFDGMPKAAQWLAEIFPLTHFLRLIRGIMLRDAHLGEMWTELAALGAFVVIVLDRGATLPQDARLTWQANPPRKSPGACI